VRNARWLRFWSNVHADCFRSERPRAIRCIQSESALTSTLESGSYRRLCLLPNLVAIYIYGERLERRQATNRYSHVVYFPAILLEEMTLFLMLHYEVFVWDIPSSWMIQNRSSVRRIEEFCMVSYFWFINCTFNAVLAIPLRIIEYMPLQRKIWMYFHETARQIAFNCSIVNRLFSSFNAVFSDLLHIQLTQFGLESSDYFRYGGIAWPREKNYEISSHLQHHQLFPSP